MDSDLEDLLAQFPFACLGFHADNGSEYINQRVAVLLNKLLIELTKSRARMEWKPRRTSSRDSRAGSKNASLIRSTEATIWE